MHPPPPGHDGRDVDPRSALAYIDHRLGRLGVPKLLARAGAKEGDVVWIGDFSFDYLPDIRSAPGEFTYAHRRQDRHGLDHR